MLRERVRANGPPSTGCGCSQDERVLLVGRAWLERELDAMLFVVVEDDLEQPAALCQVGLGEARSAVPVLDSLEVAHPAKLTVALAGLRTVDASAVLGDVLVDHGVAFAVVAG